MRSPLAVPLTISMTDEEGINHATVPPWFPAAVAMMGSRNLKRLPVSIRLQTFLGDVDQL
jgi:hypothetical protein